MTERRHQHAVRRAIDSMRANGMCAVVFDEAGELVACQLATPCPVHDDGLGFPAGIFHALFVMLVLAALVWWAL